MADEQARIAPRGPSPRPDNLKRFLGITPFAQCAPMPPPKTRLSAFVPGQTLLPPKVREFVQFNVPLLSCFRSSNVCRQ